MDLLRFLRLPTMPPPVISALQDRTEQKRLNLSRLPSSPKVLMLITMEHLVSFILLIPVIIAEPCEKKMKESWTHFQDDPEME